MKGILQYYSLDFSLLAPDRKRYEFDRRIMQYIKGAKKKKNPTHNKKEKSFSSLIHFSSLSLSLSFPL